MNTVFRKEFLSIVFKCNRIFLQPYPSLAPQAFLVLLLSEIFLRLEVGKKQGIKQVISVKRSLQTFLFFLVKNKHYVIFLKLILNLGQTTLQKLSPLDQKANKTRFTL